MAMIKPMSAIKEQENEIQCLKLEDLVTSFC